MSCAEILWVSFKPNGMVAYEMGVLIDVGPTRIGARGALIGDGPTRIGARGALIGTGPTRIGARGTLVDAGRHGLVRVVR